MEKRLFAFLICFMLLLSSCSGDVIDPIVTNAPEEFPTSELTEAPAFVSLAGYKVVRPMHTSDRIVDAAVGLKKVLDKAVENITIGDDWHRDSEELPAEALEILVGETNRPESVG
ncbi:MAG: hypothetical protein IJF21_08565, partial [Clostridia bacterium]|nr:hypothetical protein [Clostridia bacterium]